jgi:hypothetical protein
VIHDNVPFDIPPEGMYDRQSIECFQIRAVLIVPHGDFLFAWVSRVKQMYYTENIVELTKGVVQAVAKYWSD